MTENTVTFNDSFEVRDEADNVLSVDPAFSPEQLANTDPSTWADAAASLIQTAPEWEMMISEGVAASPEGQTSGEAQLGATAVAPEIDSSSSLAERRELSRIGGEAWRTMSTVDLGIVVAEGDEFSRNWFRSKPPRPEEMTDDQFADLST